MQIYLPSRRKSSVYSCCDTFDKGFTATPTNVWRPSTSLRTCGDVGSAILLKLGNFLMLLCPLLPMGFL